MEKKITAPRSVCIKQVKSEKKDYNQDALDIHPILSLSSVLLMSFYDENVTVRTPVSNCFFDKFCARIVHTLCLGMDPKLGGTQSLIFGYGIWNRARTTFGIARTRTDPTFWPSFVRTNSTFLPLIESIFNIFDIEKKSNIKKQKSRFAFI